jgi:hypothetical protein
MRILDKVRQLDKNTRSQARDEDALERARRLVRRSGTRMRPKT